MQQNFNFLIKQNEVKTFGKHFTNVKTFNKKINKWHDLKEVIDINIKRSDVYMIVIGKSSEGIFRQFRKEEVDKCIGICFIKKNQLKKILNHNYLSKESFKIAKLLCLQQLNKLNSPYQSAEV